MLSLLDDGGQDGSFDAAIELVELLVEELFQGVHRLVLQLVGDAGGPAFSLFLDEPLDRLAAAACLGGRRDRIGGEEGAAG